jgi:enoyl-[acyl-carrier protein] reductase II
VVNRIQKLLGAKYPVIQAPTTYIAQAEPAAAISAAGGLGMIETLTAAGRADLCRVRATTDRPVIPGKLPCVSCGPDWPRGW